MDFLFRLEKELERSIKDMLFRYPAMAFIFGSTFSFIFG